ncbi:ATP-binding protein [Candidatus Babeliales bacterium]|nr:ATP-binding protein [Candidatus Babeliales bacterium]
MTVNVKKSKIMRYFKEPESSYFLFGPHGVGKLAFLKQRYPDALIFDLQDPKTYLYISADLSSFIRELKTRAEEKIIIIINEAQKIPDFLWPLRHMVSPRNKWRFILTSSNIIKIKKQIDELLFHGMEQTFLYPLMACELKEKFDFDEALKHGTLLQKDKTLENIEKEIRTSGVVLSYEKFIKFLKALSLYHGSTLSISSVARECGVKRTTVNDWISLLEGLFVCIRIPEFNRLVQHQTRHHPRFYFFDVGLYRKLCPSSTDEMAMKGLVAYHLMAWKENSSGRHDHFFWKMKSGAEIDFHFFGNIGCWTINLKDTKIVKPEDIRSLVSYRKKYSGSKTIFIYSGRYPFLENGVLCLPCEEFLKGIVPNKPLV